MYFVIFLLCLASERSFCIRPDGGGRTRPGFLALHRTREKSQQDPRKKTRKTMKKENQQHVEKTKENQPRTNSLIFTSFAKFCYVLLCFAMFCYVFAMFCYVFACMRPTSDNSSQSKSPRRIRQHALIARGKLTKIVTS